MLVQAEVLLMALALGLYLYDSALLLHVNEGMLAPSGSRRWRVLFGSRNLGLGGKELYLPSPLLPHRPAFRLLWDPRPETPEEKSAWDSRRELFKPLAPLVWVIAFALFVLLPLGLLLKPGDHMLIAALALLYLNIVASLVWLIRRRRQLGVPGRKLVALAFELLVCPPFAVNVVRRVSAELTVRGDLMALARRLQQPEDWNATRRQLLERLEEQIDAEAEDSERMALLKGSRQQLLEEAPCRA